LGVVIITMDRCDELARTLDVLRDQGDGFPTVVVDNASQDGTPEMVRREHPEVELVHLPVNLAAAGRDVGVRHLGLPYVAFIDDDTWPEPGALARAVEVLDQHPEVALLTSHVLVGEERRADPVCEVMARSPLATAPQLPGRAVAGFVAGASVVRSDAFLAAGGFSRCSDVGGEEEILALDLLEAGWTLLYCPEVVVNHHPSPVRSHVARDRANARNRLRVAWLRRRGAEAVRITVEELRRGRSLKERTALLADAVKLLPVLRERQPLSPSTEQVLDQLRQADAAA
jgi:GT2 family glycosyltransferase